MEYEEYKEYEEIYYLIEDLKTMKRKLIDLVEEAKKKKNQIRSKTDDLHDYWKDGQYDRFNKYVHDIEDEINVSLNQVETAQRELEEYICHVLADI